MYREKALPGPGGLVEMELLRPFQRQFIKQFERVNINIAALSMARGNGKSWLAGYLITRILDPNDELFREGTESVLCAASIEQARIVFRFARQELEPRGGYAFLDSHTRIGIRHKETNTRLRVLSSNAKTAMGLVNCPYAICDEPGSWEVRGGQLMQDALETALGKPNSPLKIVYIGTLAPAEDGWWHDLVKGGSDDSTYVQLLKGDPDTWDSWPTIRKANPLTNLPGQAGKQFRKQLLRERDKARRDERLKARFLSYRLNIPSRDSSDLLLTLDEWLEVLSRPVPPRQGKPIVGVDMGSGRAWTTAVALWSNGRCEALALCPGSPSLEDQEKRDRVAKGTYASLPNLYMCPKGQKVPLASDLYRAIKAHWGTVRHIVGDNYRKNELDDALPAGVLEARQTRHQYQSEDVRSLRRIALDGPLAIEEQSRPLLSYSIGVSKTVNDKAGNTILIKKKGKNNESRDDVAAALVLAGGAFVRETGKAKASKPRRSRLVIVG